MLKVWRHLGRVWGVLAAVPLTYRDLTWIRRFLSPVFFTLFRTMHLADQHHCLRTALYCWKAAQKESLSVEATDTLVRAALLHDVGKAAVPPVLLMRIVHAMSLPTMIQSGLAGILPRGREQLKGLQLHAEWGAELLHTIPTDPVIVSLVRHHHSLDKPDRLLKLLQQADAMAG